MPNEHNSRVAEIETMSVEDQLRFAEALINPPAPNDALRRAAKLHAEHVEVRQTAPAG